MSGQASKDTGYIQKPLSLDDNFAWAFVVTLGVTIAVLRGSKVSCLKRLVTDRISETGALLSITTVDCEAVLYAKVALSMETIVENFLQSKQNNLCGN